MQDKYVCVKPQGLMCAKWQVLQSSLGQSDLPLTKQEANDIALSVVWILVITFGIVQAKKMIKNR